MPDGQTVTLLGFVDTVGSAGGGLVGPAEGIVIVPSTIEGLSLPCSVAGTAIHADDFEASDFSAWSHLVPPLGG